MRPLLSLAALCIACPALAADIEVSSHIESVTLYPDAAQATRIAEVELPAGGSRVVLRNLSPAIDVGTLRIAGEGEGALVLGAVDLRKAVTPRHNEPAEEYLKNLHELRDATQVKVEAFEKKLAMIAAYGRGPEKAEDKVVKPQDWDAAFDVIGEAFAKTGEALRVARVKVAEVDDAIKAREVVRPVPVLRGASQDVALDVDAPIAGKYRLTVSYRLAGARWTPAYEARLETGDKGKGAKLELVRRAAISQRTGEDWSDVRLSLAAFPAAAASSAPEPRPQRIDFLEAPRPMAANMAKSMDSVGLPAAPSMSAGEASVRRSTEQLAQVDFNGVQAFFRTAGKVSLASDGTTRLVALSAQSPQVELGWKTAPALDPRAFLSAHFVNGEEAPLLPGPVTLYRDGAMIGQSALKLTASQEGADLGFGSDERVTVTRAPVKRKENEPGWFGNTKIETREFRTVVRNLHDFPVKLLVRDQTPFSENSAITVELLGQTTSPSDKDIDGKRGVLDWRVDLAPKESKEIRLAYRVKWPADRDVVVP